jgi:hypothetical protein
MKLPKSFLPDKNLDEKVEKLTDGYEEHVDKFEVEQKILDFLSKFDLNRGILYTGLDPLRFEQSNLPYEKVVYAGIACAKLFEKFYRYRFNYSSKGEGLKWLEIIDTKPIKPDAGFDEMVSELLDYYKNNSILVLGYMKKFNKYEIKFNQSHSKKDLTGVIDNFYCKKFPYLGSKYNLFLTKVVYKGLTEDEFLHSNLPSKRIEVKWKNKRWF